MGATGKKISAGSGVPYLTSQTVSNDARRKGQKLADYYAEKGEAPGQWRGSGLADLGLEPGSVVTEEQMYNLFGLGAHPDAERIEAEYVAAQHANGRIKHTSQAAVAREGQKLSRLGQKFRDYSRGQEATEFVKRTAQAFEKYNLDPEYRATFGPSPASRGEDPGSEYWAGLPEGARRSNARVPDQVRSQIRTQVGLETFSEKFGREPLDDRELQAHVARESRPAKQANSGYDVTFSAPKSVSVLWAVAPREVGKQIEAAHDKAIADALEWTEKHVAGTRRGTDGVRATDVTGLITAQFKHRDSRSGDPHLHTHVAISAKVKDAADGQWRSLDSAMLFKHLTAIGERYNAALEEHLTRDLGLQFRDRYPARRQGEFVRPIREVAGVSDEAIEAMSSRQNDIDVVTAELAVKFERDYGRAPTNTEVEKLREVAWTKTRPDKHEPRSHAEQTVQWKEDLPARTGNPDAVPTLLADSLGRAHAPSKRLTEQQARDLAGRTVHRVSAQRARFSYQHIHAEAESLVAQQDLDPDMRSVTLERVEALAMSPEFATRIDAPQEVEDPEQVRRALGDSQFDKRDSRLYATTETLAAEQRIIAAAHQHDARTVDEGLVGIALLESAANGKELNTAQAEMVRRIATTDRRLTAVVAPAGSGKTTSMEVLARSWESSGGTVIGFGPSAVAAKELGSSIQTDSDTLAKLTYHLKSLGADSLPRAMRNIGPDTLVLIDEAGMASTEDLDYAVTYASSRGAKVTLIGDTKQLAAVEAGGVLRDVAHEVGALSLTELRRFEVPGEGAATLGLRNGDVEALGWYLDQHRIRAVSAAAPQEQIYTDWQHDRARGDQALMIAGTNRTVDQLNARARADLIADGTVSSRRSAKLASGLHASTGDVVVTRKNDRRLSVSRTDWVKNGDRWTVMKAHRDGSLTVKHQDHGRKIRLPADYVAQTVDLGYAATVHGAQGQTVDRCRVLVTGNEDRELLYVGMSRGRHENSAYVTVGTAEGHVEIFTDYEVPPVAVEKLETILRKDDAAVSAHTELRRQQDPAFLLARAANTFEESLNAAAQHTLGPDRLAHIADRAEQVVPGLTEEPAWDTLHAHLALLELDGRDPIAQLTGALALRDLEGAHDKAATLDWRLSSLRSTSDGPLPWLTGIPQQLLDDDEVFGPVLAARRDVVTTRAMTYADHISDLDPADRPEWAHELDENPTLLRDVAVWRAATGVPDEDRSTLGPPPPMSRKLTQYRALEERVEVALGPRHEPAANLWKIAVEHTPHLGKDPWAPVLRERLAMGVAAGANMPVLLREALNQKPLPDEHAAAALWSRIEHHLAPVATLNNTPGLRRLRPDWTPHLLNNLPEAAGPAVIRSHHWPQLVAAVNNATTATGQPATTLLDQAIRLTNLHAPQADPADVEAPPPVPRRMLATVLAWRVHELTLEPDHVDAAPDLHEADLEAFASRLAAEHDHQQTQARADHAAGVRPGVTDHSPDTVPQPRDQDYPSDLPPLEEPADNDIPPEIDDDTYVDDAELEAFAAAWSAHDAGITTSNIPSHKTAQATPTAEVVAAGGTTRDRVLELTAAAETFYAGAYPGSAAQAHNTQRFGTDLADTPYSVGYAPTSWVALTTHLRETHGATDVELVDSSLAQWSTRGTLIDFFHDRAMYSIRDEHGTTVGLIGRDLSGSDRAVKYKNTATTPAYRKGEHLFGLHEALHTNNTNPDAKDAFVGFARTEGTADAIAVTLGSGGRLAGVAPLGTALSDKQIDLLERHSPTTTVWSAADNDTSKPVNAGLAAAAKDMTAFADRGILQRSLTVLPDTDPADMHQHHHDTWTALLAQPDQAPVTPLVLAEDTITRRGHDITSSPIASVNELRQISHHIAALPPEHWANTIEQVATRWPRDLDSPDHDTHYRAQLTLETVERALDWDPSDPRREQLDPNVLDTAADQLEATSVDPDHDAPQVEKIRSQADENRSKVAARLARRQAEAQAAQNQPQPDRRRRDDDRRQSQDRGGPSLR